MEPILRAKIEANFRDKVGANVRAKVGAKFVVNEMSRNKGDFFFFVGCSSWYMSSEYGVKKNRIRSTSSTLVQY